MIGSSLSRKFSWFIFGLGATVIPVLMLLAEVLENPRWLCRVKHRWVYSKPIQHWLMAGGDLRGLRSCSRTCRRCRRREKNICGGHTW